MTLTARVGWCPGALRPMQSGDGLLVRVKPHCATLTLDQAAGIADLAAHCGNGQIDLTGRANLQVRGVSDAALAPLQAGLDRLGLLDPNPETEAVRNIVASPLAGLDPEACGEIRPIVTALEARLSSDPACRRLTSKWSMVVDDGGALGLDDVAADLRFVCRPDGSVLVNFCGAAAHVRVEQVADVLSGIAALVADHRPAGTRGLVEVLDGQVLLEALGLGAQGEASQVGRSRVSAAETPVAHSHDPHAEQPAERACRSTHDALRPSTRRLRRLLRMRKVGDCQTGSQERLLGSHSGFVGVAPPFGGMRACDLAALVEAARRAGARDLRLTPWRVLLVTTPVIARRRSRRGDPGGAGDLDRRASLAMTGGTLEDELTALGFITRADDPRLAIVACVGAPGCHRATVSTRADAARLAGMMAPSAAVRVHVSGCAKGCARPVETPWTLVGRDGRYDLVRDGSAGAMPVARGLSFQAAAAWVSGGMRNAAHSEPR